MALQQRKSRGKRTELAAWLDAHRPEELGEAEWAAIREALAPVSAPYLRRLLRESAAKLHPLVEGVRQEDFAALERTLLGLLAEYEAGKKKEARGLVLEAKEHARFALKKHPEKQEMVLWMTTWLENPGVFPEWVKLRKGKLGV